MRCFQIKEPKPIEDNPLELVDCELKCLDESQLLVRVLCCGVCRTDLHIAEGDLPQAHYPIVPGHQVVGRVEKVGNQCRSVKQGDLVGVAWLAQTCQQCEYCLSDRENLCLQSKYSGFDFHGGYSEYIYAFEDYVYPLADTTDPILAAPLLCAGIIGYRAFKKSRVEKNQSLGLIGFGSSAHLTLKVAQYLGCEVHVASRDEKHRLLAQKMGAVTVQDTYSPFSTKVDSIIIFAPAGELVPMAMQSLKPGGTCALAGIHMSCIPEMNYEDCLFHEKSICSVEANTRVDGQEFLKIALQAQIMPHVEVFEFEQAQDALKKLKNDDISGSAVLKIAN